MERWISSWRSSRLWLLQAELLPLKRESMDGRFEDFASFSKQEFKHEALKVVDVQLQARTARCRKADK